MILVYRYRVKSLNGLLNRQARAVSYVWNFCNDRQKDALRFGGRWDTSVDLNNHISGSSQELGSPARSLKRGREQYATPRRTNEDP